MINARIDAQSEPYILGILQTLRNRAFM